MTKSAKVFFDIAINSKPGTHFIHTLFLNNTDFSFHANPSQRFEFTFSVPRLSSPGLIKRIQHTLSRFYADSVLLS